MTAEIFIFPKVAVERVAPKKKRRRESNKLTSAMHGFLSAVQRWERTEKRGMPYDCDQFDAYETLYRSACGREMVFCRIVDDGEGGTRGRIALTEKAREMVRRTDRPKLVSTRDGYGQ